MNPQQINRAIAESLGWHSIEKEGLGSLYGNTYDSSDRKPVPRFHDSLDACRLFEEKLITQKERVFYLQALAKVVLRDKNSELLAKGGTTIACLIDNLLFTTPLQRCEAYLRMKGLWKEEV